MPIDLRSLRYFAAMAQSGSISRAAQELHIAQPALSSHLKMMEAELGITLFERSARGVLLTAAGARFLAHAREILDRMKLAVEDLREVAADPIGSVRLGMPQSMGLALTVPLIKECTRRWPKIRLQVVEASTGHIPTYLANRQIDLGMVYLKEKSSGLKYSPLVSEELVLVAPPGKYPKFPANRLAKAAAVELARLEGLPLFLPSPQHSLRQLIERNAAMAHVKVKTMADVDAIPQILSLVSDGLGYSILSYHAVLTAMDAQKISVAQLVKPTMVRTAFLCRQSSLLPTQAVQSVETLILEIVSQLVKSKRWPGQRHVQ